MNFKAGDKVIYKSFLSGETLGEIVSVYKITDAISNKINIGSYKYEIHDKLDRISLISEDGIVGIVKNCQSSKKDVSAEEILQGFIDRDDKNMDSIIHYILDNYNINRK